MPHGIRFLLRCAATALLLVLSTSAVPQAPGAGDAACAGCDEARKGIRDLEKAAYPLQTRLLNMQPGDPARGPVTANVRALGDAARKLAGKLAECTAKGCGGSEEQRERRIQKLEDLMTYQAACPACAELERAYFDASETAGGMRIEFEEGVRVEDLEGRVKKIEAEIGSVQDAQAEQQRAADRAAPGSPERAAAQAQVDQLRSKVDGLREKIQGSPDAIKQQQAEYDAQESALRRAEQEEDRLRAALIECNRRLCTAVDVELGIVIGGFGNNPFDPREPFRARTDPPPPVAGAGTLQFSSASYGGGEGGAVLIVVTRSGGSAGAVSVQYATVTGTASAADFTAASGTLEWASGDSGAKSFSIALTDDTLVEPTESFGVQLSAPGGGATLGAPALAFVSIADNDSVAPPQPAGSIQFSASGFTVMENAGTATITVTRTGGAAGEVTVQYFTGPASAVAGSDYQAVNGVLTWGVGDTGAKSFNVPIINDTLVEGPETFFVTLNNPTGGATLGAPATATVTINDDDVNTGPCGATGNAWTPNAGQYACSGSCNPNPSPRLSINGDLITATQFASGGTATFQGCGQSLNSRETNLTYFGQSNHRATITRSSNTNFNANIVSSGGGTCAFSCTRTGP